ncbi:MAG: hypothetical protein V1708_04165 [Candidatus Micrarchaeota archaeon]
MEKKTYLECAALLALGILLCGCVAAATQVKFASQKAAYAKGELVQLKVDAAGGKFFMKSAYLAKIMRLDQASGQWQELDLSLGPAKKQACYSSGLGTRMDVVPGEIEPKCSRLFSAQWSWNAEFTVKETRECKGAQYVEYSRTALAGKYKAVLETFPDSSCAKPDKTLEAEFSIAG